jgi:hypothetical protein
MEAVAAQRPSGPGAESQEEDGGPMGGWSGIGPRKWLSFLAGLWRVFLSSFGYFMLFTTFTVDEVDDIPIYCRLDL